ncbi:hypothetical protein Tco_0843036 [Tanacetum coccineum]|uniref:Uncharacterized protein n=1 Tax=Tanacetum coccineum TaxID=301880 RepID=A0ABQ5B6N5_9ASTR
MDSKQKSLIRAVMKCSNYHRLVQETKLHRHGNQKSRNLKSWDFYENCGVHTLILEDGTRIHMLADRKLSTPKETIENMIVLHQELASPEQTASGKDFSNPLMADSLPKTIWFAQNSLVFNAPCYCNKDGYSRVSTASTSVSTSSRVSTVSSKVGYASYILVRLDLSRWVPPLNQARKIYSDVGHKTAIQTTSWFS